MNKNTPESNNSHIIEYDCHREYMNTRTSGKTSNLLQLYMLVIEQAASFPMQARQQHYVNLS